MVRNPVFWKMKTDNFIITPQKYPTVVLNMTTPGPVEDDTFIITWPGKSITFTVKDAPTAIDHIPSNFSGDYMDDYGANVVTYLRDHHILATDFDVLLTSGDQNNAEITFFKRAKGLTTFGNFLTNVTSILNNNITEEVRRPNFRIVLELYIEQGYNSDNWELAITEAMEPLNDSIVIFDLSDKLQAYLTEDLPDFNQSGTTMKKCQHTIKRYYIVYYERYGEPPVSQSETILNPEKCWLAGIGHLELTQYPNSTYVDDVIVPEQMFLTWDPDNKRITDVQQEYLFFLYAGSGSLTPRLFVDVYFTDETSQTDIELIPALNPNRLDENEITIIPAGYDQLDIGSIDPGKTVLKYSLYLKDSTSVISEVRTFYVDFIYSPNTRYFLFMNSFGALQTLRATGEMEKSKEVKKLTSERIADFEPAIETSLIQDDKAELRNKFTISTGFHSREYIEMLQEILLSHGYVCEIDPDRQAFLPVHFDTKKTKFFKDKDKLFYLRLKGQYAWKEVAYSRP